jgi:palmitoyl-protein thioesterase
MKIILLCSLLITLIAYRPVAYFYGLGGSCSNSNEFLKTLADESLRDIICIDYGSTEDSLEVQCERACRSINQNIKFDDEFDIVGFSQGGLIGRYIVEFCNGFYGHKKKVITYISMGTPHKGTYEIPKKITNNYEMGLESFMVINWISKKISNTQCGKNLFGVCSYLRDINNKESYKKSILAKLNNEGETINKEVKARFSSLNKVVLMYFTKDKMVVPPESAIFYEFDGKKIKVEETDFYNNDLIGFKNLMELKKIKVIKIDSDHICNDECQTHLTTLLLSYTRKRRLNFK